MEPTSPSFRVGSVDFPTLQASASAPREPRYSRRKKGAKTDKAQGSDQKIIQSSVALKVESEPQSSLATKPVKPMASSSHWNRNAEDPTLQKLEAFNSLQQEKIGRISRATAELASTFKQEEKPAALVEIQKALSENSVKEEVELSELAPLFKSITDLSGSIATLSNKVIDWKNCFRSQGSDVSEEKKTEFIASHKLLLEEYKKLDSNASSLFCEVICALGKLHRKIKESSVQRPSNSILETVAKMTYSTSESLVSQLDLYEVIHKKRVSDFERMKASFEQLIRDIWKLHFDLERQDRASKNGAVPYATLFGAGYALTTNAIVSYPMDQLLKEAGYTVSEANHLKYFHSKIN